MSVYRSGKDEEFRHGKIARSSYKLAQVLHALDESESKCRELLDSAKAIRATMSLDQQIQQRAPREGETEEESREVVYDQGVSLWARQHLFARDQMAGSQRHGTEQGGVPRYL